MKLPSSEFVTTNGIGGYASTTILGANTTKFHGLLVTSNDKLDRFVLISTLFEKIKLPDISIDLTTAYFKNNYIFPEGYKYFKEFHDFPLPTFSYEFEGIHVTKELAMLDGFNTTIVKYVFDTPMTIVFSLLPFIANRKSDELTSPDNLNIISVEQSAKDEFTFNSLNNSTTLVKAPSFTFQPNKDIYYDFYYRKDFEDGNPHLENLLKPGNFEIKLSPGHHELHICMINEKNKQEADRLFSRMNFNKLFDFSHVPSKLNNNKRLFWHASKFIVTNDSKPTIISGYPWFKDFGRDAFISFKGLLLITRKYNIAKEILKNWAKSLKNGLIPNILGEDDYHSIDASLWFIDAAWQYYKFTNDLDTIREIYTSLRSIIYSFIEGTDFGIKVNSEGLLTYTDVSQALTWMDAKIDGMPVIDRSGASVEVQALWFNALNIMERLSVLVGGADIELICRDKKDQIQKTFYTKFKSNTKDYLYDVVRNDGTVDYSFRPNQIFAFSLEFPIFESVIKAKKILMNIEDELFTPVGLRTLSPMDPRFQKNYYGDMRTRDNSYHQGTIWPWLLGPYIKAYLQTHGYHESARRRCKNIIKNYFAKMESDNQFEFSEIYESATLEPKGCIEQAWTVAQLIEAKYECEK